LEPDELSRDFGEALAAPLRPAILDHDRAPLDPAEFAQPLHKGGGPWAPSRRYGSPQVPDCRQLCGLLRARRERPRRCAAKQRDELAPLHSITSSAATSSLSGTVMPSIRAVWWLMTSSNLVDCSTGNSAGFAPLRMRPV